MTKEQRERLKKLFITFLPKNGSPVGNITLCPKFLKQAKKQVQGLVEDDYWNIRNELLDEGELAIGRGKGGSVFLVLNEQEQTSIENAECGPTYEREADLYDHFYKTVSTTWVKQKNIRNFVVEITAHQGRRKTGGAWTRPDVSLITIGKFTFIPGKILEVVTFEIKPLDDFSISGLFETSAHAAFAHKSFLAIHTARGDDSSPDPALERLKSEARRVGVGLLLFQDPTKWSTFDTLVEPVRRDPDPEDVNIFISTQISRDRQTELLEMLK